MQSTPIEWATYTWNVTRGCSRVSPGCGGPHGDGGCYAEKVAARFSGPGLPYEGRTTRGKWNGAMRLIEEKLYEPLRRKKPERIFVNSMSDLFHENLTNHEIARVFATMARAHWHTFLVLTKRHERLPKFFAQQEPPIGYTWPLPNVFLGVSVENQEYADRRIPHLLQTPAAVRFLSVEPMIGPVRLDQCAPHILDGDESNPGVVNAFNGLAYHPRTVRVRPPVEGSPNGIQWVIVGGESGNGARPMHPDWARFVRDQCIAAKVPYFFKQWGAWAPIAERFRYAAGIGSGNAEYNRELARFAKKHGASRLVDDRPEGWDAAMIRDGCALTDGDMALGLVGKHAAGRLLDGRTWDEFPHSAEGEFPANVGAVATSGEVR